MGYKEIKELGVQTYLILSMAKSQSKWMKIVKLRLTERSNSPNHLNLLSKALCQILLKKSRRKQLELENSGKNNKTI